MIYVNLFYALISTRYIEHKHFLLAKIKLVLGFFKTTCNYESVVEIYRELFVWMPICFGKTHSETIKGLVEFSQICFRISLYEEAATACFYVYSCFHIAHGYPIYEGFQAAYLLCHIYELQYKLDLAYEVHNYLWRTFVRFGDEYKLDIAINGKIHTRYMQYACVCEQREEHRETSIQLYRSAMKHCKEAKPEFVKKTLHACNLRTARLYASSTKEIAKAICI
jgi:hypothetical protein